MTSEASEKRVHVISSGRYLGEWKIRSIPIEGWYILACKATGSLDHTATGRMETGEVVIVTIVE
jgi:hypothetical protein